MKPRQVEAVADDVARYGLHGFVRHFWGVADPNPFSDNWHIGAICEVLTAVSERTIGNVIINIPPGAGKTKVVGILWPAWHWGPFDDPSHWWMFASHDATLSRIAASAHHELVSSDLYQAIWPVPIKKVQPASRFVNGAGGLRLSTTPRAKGTGHHAHTQVCDDPIKAQKADSADELEYVRNWWQGTMSSRVAGDPDRFRRLIIMQRLAEHDLAGEMLKLEGYEHLCLPLEYVERCFWDRGCSIGNLDARSPDYVRGKHCGVEQGIEGQPLDLNRFSAKRIAGIKKEQSPQVLSAQYQQNPVPMVGGIVELDWLRRQWSLESVPIFRRVIQSWDLGFKGFDRTARRQSRSRCHGALWAEHDGLYYLLDMVEPMQLNYPGAKELFIGAQIRKVVLPRQTITWGQATPKLIEDKASGTDLIAELRGGVLIDGEQAKMVEGVKGVTVSKIQGALRCRVNGLPAKMPSPKDPKEVRLKIHSDKMRGSQVLLPPDGLIDLEAFRTELVGFPHAQYDDMVDTTTQALDYLENKQSRWGALEGR